MEKDDENTKFIMAEDDLIPNARMKLSTKIFMGDECRRCQTNDTERELNDP
jgi:ABC-type transporter MlaC component